MTFEITLMSLDFDSDEGIQTKHFDYPELKIGRSGENDLVLGGEAVSELHATLRANLSGPEPVIEITDLGSATGTMIDNHAITPNVPQQLKKNQRIMIGSFLIRPAVVAEFKEKIISNGFQESVQQHEEEISVAHGIGRIIPKSSEVEEPLHNFDEDPAYEALPVDNEEASEFSVFDSFLAEEKDEVDHVAANQENEVSIDIAKPTFSNQAITSSAGAFIAEGVVSESISELVLEAQRLLNLKIKVQHNSRPLAAVKFDGGNLGNFETDTQGLAELSGLLEGLQFNLKPSLAGYKISGPKFSGTLNDDLELVFNAVRLLDIKGRILHNGQPLSGVIVDGGELGQVSTDSTGFYCFKDVPEGTKYKLAVKKAGFVFKKH